MAFVFALALLLDSACAAACVPAELQTRSEHCATGHDAGSSERGCDRNVHLKPAVENRSAVAPAAADDAPAFLDNAPMGMPHESLHSAIDRDAVLHVPPLFQRSSVLRI